MSAARIWARSIIACSITLSRLRSQTPARYGHLRRRRLPTDTIHAAATEIAKALRGELMLSSARNRYMLQRVERTLADVIAAQQAMMKRSRYRPIRAGISFGHENSPMPALQVTTPCGDEMRLHGKIDRIDILPDGNDALVIDYRLGANSLSLQHVFHGLSLQLLASLLVLEAGGEQLAGRSLTPTAAFYLGLLRSFGDVDHPDDAIDPRDERYLLAIKPRGLFDFRALHDLDTGLEKGPSLVVQAYLKQMETIGYPGSTDSLAVDDSQDDVYVELVARAVSEARRRNPLR